MTTMGGVTPIDIFFSKFENLDENSVEPYLRTLSETELTQFLVFYANNFHKKRVGDRIQKEYFKTNGELLYRSIEKELHSRSQN